MVILGQIFRCFFLLRNEEEHQLDSVSNSNVTMLNSTISSDGNQNCTEGQSSEQEVNWNDAIVFKYLAFGALALGLFFSMLFHCFVHENTECNDEGMHSNNTQNGARKSECTKIG